MSWNRQMLRPSYEGYCRYQGDIQPSYRLWLPFYQLAVEIRRDCVHMYHQRHCKVYPSKINSQTEWKKPYVHKFWKYINKNLESNSSKSIVIHHRSKSMVNHHRSKSTENHHRSKSMVNHHRSKSMVIHHRSKSTENHHRSKSMVNHHRSKSMVIHHRSKSMVNHHRSKSMVIHHRSKSMVNHHRSKSMVNHLRSKSMEIHHRKVWWFITEKYGDSSQVKKNGDSSFGDI